MMGRSSKRFLAAAALVAAGAPPLGAGCSGDDDDGPVSGAPVSDDGAFLKRYAAAACRAVGPCCAENNYGYEADSCQTAVEGLLLIFMVNPAKARGDTYDAAKAGDCLALVESRAGSVSCLGDDDNDDGGVLDRACDLVYRSGTKAPGEACEEVEECAESEEGEVNCRAPNPAGSSPPPGGTAKVCQLEKIAPAQAGDPCNGAPGPPWVYAACDGDTSELRCDPASRSCQPRLALGQDCGTDPGGCARDAYCAQTQGGTFARACAARLPVGGACASDGDCARDAYCDDGAKLCAARRPAGEPCKGDEECAGGACDAGRCLANPVGTSTLCSPG